MVLVVTCNCGFAGKIERIKGNRPLGKIRRNRATIALTKFFLRHRGFQRVSTGCRAPDRVDPKGGRP